MEADLLIVGGDESGCAAAVQAARLGVDRIVLVNDIDWLGGQFCTQGIGPI
jgi:tRNA U34 5-carboxymethylaminomethyl modifying enzyme MnmG/GidA